VTSHPTPVRRRVNVRLIVGYGVALVVLVAMLSFPDLSGNAYDVGRVQLSLVYILAALGLNAAYGLAGEFTLGHAVIMATGAYTSGILTAHFQWGIWPALIAGVVSGIVMSLALGAPSVRVRGAYLGLLTLFAVLAIPPAVVLGEKYTGGETGLLGIPSITFGIFTPAKSTYVMTVVAVAVVLFVLRNLARSEWGTRFALLREAPRAAESVGLHTAGIKFIAYAIFGAVAGLAGVLVAYNDGIVVSGTFGINLTLLLLTGVVLGGKGTIWGPVLGTVPLILLSFYVGPFSQANPIVFGVVLIVAVLLFPNGIVPAFRYGLQPAWRSGGLGAVLRKARHRTSHRPGEERETASTSLDEALEVHEAHEAHEVTIPEDLLQARGAFSDSTGPLLEIVELRKSFGGVQAIKDVSLAVGRGRVVGLVGQNGCGKSTLLNLIGGFYRPDSGTVRIAGTETTGWRPNRIARAGVGRTFQVPRLMPKETVADNIAAGLLKEDRPRLFASMLGLPGPRKAARSRHIRAVEMVTVLGLQPRLADELADSLPLGMKRIVEVGRAAVGWPSLLLLDEPAAGLNEEERDQLAKSVAALARAGVTPIVVEHNIEFVLDLCDVVVLMESGQVACVYDRAADETMPTKMVGYLRYAEVE
jgi:branched-chain amino acid transport system permease protein